MIRSPLTANRTSPILAALLDDAVLLMVHARPQFVEQRVSRGGEVPGSVRLQKVVMAARYFWKLILSRSLLYTNVWTIVVMMYEWRKLVTGWQGREMLLTTNFFCLSCVEYGRYGRGRHTCVSLALC